MKIKPKPSRPYKLESCGGKKGRGCSWAGETKMIPLNTPLAKAA